MTKQNRRFGAFRVQADTHTFRTCAGDDLRSEASKGTPYKLSALVRVFEGPFPPLPGLPIEQVLVTQMC